MDMSLVLMLEEATDGRCSICNRTEQEASGFIKALAVDHNHTSGEVRGLLCQQCNQGIGLFGDDPERLRLAADYVEFHLAADEMLRDREHGG